MHAAVSPRLLFADRLGAGAIALAPISALARLIVPDGYRDRTILVDATRADTLSQATLLPGRRVAGRRGPRNARRLLGPRT
jgi:hypothetical protein